MVHLESSKDYVVVMKGITKVYPGGVVANRNIDFDLKRGEIHALLGENGAGKTTLMKILAGCLLPDKGEIYVKGERVKFRSPVDAIKKGIGMVHQHFTLIPSFTVAENIILGGIGGKREGIKLDMKAIEEEIAEFAKKHGLPINPKARIEELPVGLKQRVEILRLLYRKADILILDEPTSVLTPLEVKELFEALKRMASEGKSIVFVTHKLDEALSISDRITVLRKGEVVARIDNPKSISKEKLAELVVGRKIVYKAVKTKTLYDKTTPLMEIRNLKVLDDRGVLAVRNLNLTLYPGEILGLAGVEGNGQRELVEAITGLRRVEEGEIVILGKKVTNKPPKYIIELGVSYIPEDRTGRGVALELSVAENLIAKVHDKTPFSRRGILNLKSIYSFAKEAIEKFNIVTPSVKTPTMYLSGGNIQRLILARELSFKPKIIIAEQPTAGLDVAATEFIHKLLIDFRNSGCGILLISADIDEILKLSDRVAVIYGGRIVKVYDEVSRIDLIELSKYMLGVKTE
ncbi:MAG TPA: ABC transporter ATP-binding protein [Desulfurococcales archaeon]|nr:ABC transporter ATP-binding protein [Desulfurococcales archaeon]